MKSLGTVFVGLSGGVDSSVAALRLKKQGYTVVGVFIKVWHPDFMVCNWEAERLDAMRVAAHLEIPFLTCDAETAYRDEVALYFVNEYLAGRTPNPDVMCNRSVKFGHFMRFARERGADYIATGHFAQRIAGKDGPELHRGVDNNKDQTYFLWTLSNEQLARSLFPVGSTTKEQIRAEARHAKIPVATKQDSQGICFLGHIDIRDFLSHYTTLIPGPVLNTAGETIGSHQGALVYTIGQRHGFTLHTTSQHTVPHFVTAKDCLANTITVSAVKPVMTAGDTLTLEQIVLRSEVSTSDTLQVQTRYRQTPINVAVSEYNNKRLTLITTADTESIASGQSCVLYRNTHCIGGGIIQ